MVPIRHPGFQQACHYGFDGRSLREFSEPRARGRVGAFQREHYPAKTPIQRFQGPIMTRYMSSLPHLRSGIYPFWPLRIIVEKGVRPGLPGFSAYARQKKAIRYITKFTPITTTTLDDPASVPVGH